MSKTESCTKRPLVAPADSDEQFLLRQEYEDPIVKASTWLHKLIIHRIRDVQAARAWYRGETDEQPQHLISELFNQEDGRFCNRFAYYGQTIKKYGQGSVPRHVIDDDHRDATILIRTLSELTDDTETLRLATRLVNEFADLVTSRQSSRLASDDYLAKIGNLSACIVTAFGRVSDVFKRIEQVRRGERSEPATRADVASVQKTAEKTDRKADILLVKQEEIRKTVTRLDRRERKAKKNARQRFSVETQELVYNYWERGGQNSTLKRESGKHRVSYEQVFAYYKDELHALKIESLSDFAACMGTRSDRIAYERKKRLVHSVKPVSPNKSIR